LERFRVEIEEAVTMGDAVVHPGKRLAAELAEMGVSARDFAQGIGVPPNRVTQILKGERSITADTALRLGHFFGTSAMTWMNLQSRWDLVQAMEVSGKEVVRLPTLKGWRAMNEG
jgi:addiction module HigA family antidote